MEQLETTFGKLLAVAFIPIAAGHWGCREYPPLERCRIIRKSWKDTDYPCGHPGAERYALDIYGEEFWPSKTFLSEHPECPACALDAVMAGVIRCAMCGYAILAGEDVTLYLNEGAFDPAWTTAVADGYGAIACLRLDCRSPFCDREGRWDGRSFVRAFERPIRLHIPHPPFRLKLAG
ncbi:MAG: hypothetical protein V1745_03840 [Patescibacteria group bacterium]